MGRPLGSPNKNKLEAINKRIEALGFGTPMQLLLKVMVDEKADLFARMDAAKALLPYMHRKQPTATEIELSGSKVLVEKLEEIYGHKQIASDQA